MFITITTKTFGNQVIDTNQYKPFKSANKSTIYRAFEYCLYGDVNDIKLYEKRANILQKMELFINHCINNKIGRVNSNILLDFINQYK